jgi:hypothetical protein
MIGQDCERIAKDADKRLTEIDKTEDWGEFFSLLISARSCRDCRSGYISKSSLPERGNVVSNSTLSPNYFVISKERFH